MKDSNNLEKKSLSFLRKPGFARRLTTSIAALPLLFASCSGLGIDKPIEFEGLPPDVVFAGANYTYQPEINYGGGVNYSLDVEPKTQPSPKFNLKALQKSGFTYGKAPSVTVPTEYIVIETVKSLWRKGEISYTITVLPEAISLKIGDYFVKPSGNPSERDTVTFYKTNPKKIQEKYSKRSLSAAA